MTLVEYGDYECPYCGRAYPVVKEIQKRLGERLRFVFRNFPLNTIHEHAGVAAQAAEAAGEQGKFWEMHDLLYQHQDDLADADLRQYALKLGLEIYRFDADNWPEYLEGLLAWRRDDGLALAWRGESRELPWPPATAGDVHDRRGDR